jgi:hypothetical protein
MYVEKPLSLNPEQDGILRRSYFKRRIPRDQYKRRPDDLADLVAEFNRLTGLDESGEQLVRYIKNQQKAKRRLQVPWPTFEGAHKKAPPLSHTLDDKQLEVLMDIYERVVLPLQIGTDSAEASRAVCDMLAKEFARRTGIVMLGLNLLSIAEEKRKRGEWYTVGKRGAAWGDLDQVEQIDRLKEASGAEADKKSKKRKPK